MGLAKRVKELLSQVFSAMQRRAAPLVTFALIGQELLVSP